SHYFSPHITSHYSSPIIFYYIFSFPIISFSLLFTSITSSLSPITPFRLLSLLFVSHHSFSSYFSFLFPITSHYSFLPLSFPITFHYSIVISF
ncbi:hypothetical protein C1646_686644, partial [Rhizophagus diaphanus]